MNRSFLDFANARSHAKRAFLTGSLGLCGLAALASAPALADSTTFGGSISATVTVPTIANVVYTASADPSPSSATFLQGNAWGTAQSSSFSWGNGTLSVATGSATGWAASQVDSATNFAYVSQLVTPTLELTNNNPYAVEIPITAALTYAQNITCSACGVYDQNWVSSSAWLYLYTDSSGQYNSLGITGLNCFLGSVFGPPYNGSCQTDSSPVTAATFPVSGSFLETLDYWVPADSSATIDVELQSQYQADVATPEPRSWLLMGTGLLGLMLVIHLRVRTS